MIKVEQKHLDLMRKYHPREGGSPFLVGDIIGEDEFNTDENGELFLRCHICAEAPLGYYQNYRKEKIHEQPKNKA